MGRLVDLEKLDRMDNLIRRKATGTPDEFAERLGMKLRTLYEVISYLKEALKAPIVYNSSRLSYEYIYPPKFHLGFERDNLELTGLEKTYGDTVINEEKTKIETKGGKKIIEIEIDEDDFVIDEDIDFNELYL